MRHRAFTLVELLVVIAIVALLAALSFVAFGGSRRQAQRIACQANLHELLLTLATYDSEHQSLPCGFDFRNGAKPPGGYAGDMEVDPPGWWWFHSAGAVRNKFREGMKLLQCPSKRLDDPRLDSDLLCGNYGVNRALCKTAAATFFLRPLYKKDFAGTPFSLGSLHQSSSTLLLVDSGYSLICWWNATADPPVTLDPNCIEDTAYVPGLEINKSKVLWPGQTADAIGGRHENRTVNVGFADGHADPKPARDLLVEKRKDGTYTNTRLWLGQ